MWVSYRIWFDVAFMSQDILLDQHLCEFCEDTGFVSYPVWDDDSKTYQDIGIRECVCQKKQHTEPEDAIE